MPPPVTRSPPFLRSTASTDTVPSDPPDHEVCVLDAARKNTTYTPAAAQQQMQPASSDKTNSTAINIKSKSSPMTTLPSTSKEAAIMAEMQKQLQSLKRQLLDTQSQLSETTRKCQQLESASQLSTQTVSDPNLNSISISNSAAIDFANTTTKESRNSQATNTCTTPHYAQPVTAASVAMTSTQAAPLLNANAPIFTNNYVPPFLTNTCTNQQQPATDNFNAYGTYNGINEVMLPRKIQDLPVFSGEPEDWPLFYTAYNHSTAAYGYSNFENNQRLQKCLKGDAKEMVTALLIHPDNVNAVIEQLKFRFGRPELLIHSQLKRVKELPYVNENNLVKLVPFSTKVKNLTVFLKSVNGEQHIANPTLLEELVARLPMSKKLEWARTAANIRPYPTIEHFSEWLSETANLICMVQDVNNSEPKRRVLHATEKVLQCPVCKGNHKIYDCRKFFNLKVNERWEIVKKIRACFSCLNIGHLTRECRIKELCPVRGCQRKHHKLLHDDVPSVSVSVEPSTSAMSEVNQNVLSCSNDNKNCYFVYFLSLYMVKSAA